MQQVKLHEGDCLDILKTLADESVDSIVTDPPYGLSFMGKKWDYDVPSVDIWKECLRVLKPGGHLLSFAGARTYHRMAVRIEDAGFEIRDQMMWLYGSGFPKSQNIGKAMVKLRGTDIYPEVNGQESTWDGMGTNLKPAHEPIVMARKPFKRTVARNVLAYGTGALNIDLCRVPFAGGADEKEAKEKNQHSSRGNGALSGNVYHDMSQHSRENYNASGRWPANVLHDGSEPVVSQFPQSSVTGKRSEKSRSAKVSNTDWLHDNHISTEHTDCGSTARFFYCPKTSPTDRHEGLVRTSSPIKHGSTLRNIENMNASLDGNRHPTVKPTQLMAYLCRLVTPAGGLVLDPFMGSGSTGKGAVIEGFRFIGIEREYEYVNIARARITFVLDKLGMQHGLTEA
ncbi:site-specific DNA-methyltransferase (plasmid) [Citrobacter freundii]|uniref:DNA-methyltransferase n=1 Tax=Citrobacter freundii TaxID=546 RepID=UPI0015E92E58|nr:site-specific DNA-methyltransferase [Citrobacter freundii]QLV95569.1 site-specific DNA-methyltransferase [Citrobacter freundii]